MMACAVTDLPDPDFPNTATLWLPAAFSNGDQKKGWPRRPISSRCGAWPPRYSPWSGARFAAVVLKSVRMRFMRARSLASPFAMVMGIAQSRPMIWR